MNRRMLWLVCATIASLWVGSASAQSLTGVRVTFFRQGQTTPAVAPFTIPIAEFTCGVAVVPAPTGTVQNPTEYRVTDPANASADCVKRAAAGDPLLLLAFDPAIVYVAKASYINIVGTGPESANSNPFARPGSAPTATPVALRIVRDGL